MINPTFFRGWHKTTDDSWYELLGLDLTEVRPTSGVYVIWAARAQRYLWVGQSENLQERLRDHRDIDQRNNSPVAQYIFDHMFDGEKLFVTWAYVKTSHLDGIERYLGEALNPLLTKRLPQAGSIEAPLP